MTFSCRWGVWEEMNINVAVKIGGCEFKNPVFLASGPVGYGVEYEGLLNLDRIGAVITKTITLKPRRGNEGRRIHETPSGLLNSIGLENVGVEVFISEKLPLLVEKGIRFIVSVAAEDWEEYRELLEVVGSCKEIEAVEVNLSCPNVDRGGMVIGTNPDLVRHYISHARGVLKGRTIIAKLTPNVSDISTLAVAAEETGADALTAINTVVGMDIDIDNRSPVFDRITAGLSGPAILPIALASVWKVARSVEIPVVASGGISSVEDALKFFMAGAAAVQVGTAMFYDPALPERIVDYLERNGVPDRI